MDAKRVADRMVSGRQSNICRCISEVRLPIGNACAVSVAVLSSVGGVAVVSGEVLSGIALLELPCGWRQRVQSVMEDNYGN